MEISNNNLLLNLSHNINPNAITYKTDEEILEVIKQELKI